MLPAVAADAPHVICGEKKAKPADRELSVEVESGDNHMVNLFPVYHANDVYKRKLNDIVLAPAISRALLFR